MFNRKESSSEIAEIMESKLITHAIEKKASAINKFAQALDRLNEVAEIFEEIGLDKEAEFTTQLIEVLAAKKGKKSKKPAKKKVKKVMKSDPAMKDLTSEKMVDNLKDKGWVFNADDMNHDDDCECSYCSDMNFAKDKKTHNHGHDCACMKCADYDMNNHFDVQEDFTHHVDHNSVDDELDLDDLFL
jgi:hypothetical protein